MDLAADTIRKVRQTILKNRMLGLGDSVIAAVSGGPDSVCLLDILNELKADFGLELTVAHFDHGLRPGEDEAETMLVKSLACSFNLRFEAVKADINSGISGSSLEEKARNARYDFLEKVRLRLSADKIAMGHNLNDQAETVLMRLLRGSGLSGLSGMAPCREGGIIRPLIELTRAGIESYLKERGLEYAIDSSNLKNRFLRNSIRNELIPVLAEYQPRIVEILGQTAGIIKREDEWLESEAGEWFKKNVATRKSGEILISSVSLAGLAPALRNRAVRYALKMAGGGLRRISSRHIEAVSELAEGSSPHAGVDLPNMVTVRRIYDSMAFSRGRKKLTGGFTYALEGPGPHYLDAVKKIITLEEIDGGMPSDIKSSGLTAFLNADLLSYPLIIRNFRPGDRFVPLGMKGHKKLKNFFIDMKIPSEERLRIPVLTCCDNPVWVCGMRIDDRYRVTADTGRILKVTMAGL